MNIVLSLGFLIGLAYGVVGLLSGFCLLTSLRKFINDNDGDRLRSFALAVATAMIGTQLLAGFGLVDLGKSIYLLPSFSLPLLLGGGLIFGYGMVLANGCGSRATVLLGKGNLRSFVVVVTLGITAQMTLRGLLATPRVAVLNNVSVTPPANSLNALLAQFAGSGAGRVFAVLLIAGALVIFALVNPAFRRARGQLAAGVAMGLLVTAGWFVTGYLGNDDFEPSPVTSLTFVAPIADAVQYVMLSTGMAANFGIVTVAGVLLGSLATALITRSFELEGFRSARHLLRSIAGAAMMGIGGAMAFGCSIGQGLTGMSTLSFASMIAITGTVVGITSGLRGPLRVPALAPAA